MFTLREVHSLAFDRVGDDHRWLIGISRRLGAFQGRDNLRKVVPVDLEATPAKLLEYASPADAIKVGMALLTDEVILIR